MPKTVIVGSETFEIPVEGENSGYGESLTDFFVAVADALSTVQKPNDIADTTAPINNNISSFTNITGFIFDTSEVIQIQCTYQVERSTTSPAVTLVESGEIEGNYNGTDWTITIESEGDAQVEFDITAGGQMRYKSEEMVGTGYTGSIAFRAKVFNN
jgi:hypothetical protein